MRRLPAVLLASFALLAVSAPQAAADLASMVADLDTEAGPNLGSTPYSFVRVGSRAVFFARPEPGGPTLVYATDGTSGGVERLPVDEQPASAAGAIGGAYLWFGYPNDPNAWGYSLWRTAGTAATTERLVAGPVYEPPYGSVLSDVVVGRLYFLRWAADLAVLELWASDGTAEGTGRVASLGRIGDYPVALKVHGSAVFYLTARIELEGGHPFYSDWKLWRTRPAASPRLVARLPHSVSLHSTARRLVFFSGGRLWASDGSPGGTGPVAAPPGEPAFEVTWIGGIFGGRFYFGGRDRRHGDALWSSDGTAAGTRLLARGLRCGGGCQPGFEPLALGDRLFFVASDGVHGFELWSTRGTPATTAMVADVCPGPCSAFPEPAYGRQLAAAGGRVVFLADDGSHGREPWATDGTAGGTRLLRDHCPGACGVATSLEPAGGDVFYYLHAFGAAPPGGSVHGVEMWASDGSPAGTRRLTARALIDTFIPPEGQLPDLSLARLGSRLVSIGWDPRGGEEPWVYDAAAGGGRALADLATVAEPAPGSEPFDAVALGERLLFLAGSGERTFAWSTLGTAETTVALGELPPPRRPFEPPLIAVAGGVAYLNLGELWASDGTPRGTERLTDFAATAPGSRVSTAVVEAGGRLVFGVTAGGSQVTELWTSDGTPAGTRRAGTPPFPLRIFDLTAVGDDLYFWAADAATGWEIWTSGSSLDTLRRLTDRPGQAEPGPLWAPPAFSRMGAHVYFQVPERSSASGVTLWRSDGTAAGTAVVPAPQVEGVDQQRRAFACIGDSVLLVTADEQGRRFRLWRGSGSGSDWVELHDFGPGSGLLEVVPRTDDALIVTWEESGQRGPRLYRTDGTAAGTVLEIDFSELGVGHAHSLTPIGERLVFAAGDGPFHTELWWRDEAPGTARRLHEIAPGEAGSEPRGFTVAGSRLYFSADDGLHGRELWSLALAELEAPCRPSATALCLGDGRFRAELFRHDRTGEYGDGRAIPWSSASGAFWFYDYGNPEAAVKMVDGGAVNDGWWLFHGPLGDAHLALTVTDLETGEVRRWPDEPGPLPAFADLAAFPSEGTASAGERGPAREPIGEAFADLERAAESAASTIPAPAEIQTAGACFACMPGPTALCLQDGRFAVELSWTDPGGAEHAAFAFAHGGRAGYFAFYGARDLQAALKILDGRAVDGRFWLFATSATHLGYELKVTDVTTGTVHRYPKPAGAFASVVDFTSLR